MLSDIEKAWLNTYHKTVFSRISPYLSEEEKEWLKEKTSRIE
ncbi:MAG: M24 family metallopeptidase C-terminal domain-containing protein [Paludibacteraceae bacterium]|nr:M24 family metallopeptidase C-terminal domain-containing protein [Paludibacteraceae bacterium]